MDNIETRVIPANCDFSAFYTEQQDQTLGLIILSIAIIITIISLICAR